MAGLRGLFHALFGTSSCGRYRAGAALSLHNVFFFYGPGLLVRTLSSAHISSSISTFKTSTVRPLYHKIVTDELVNPARDPWLLVLNVRIQQLRPARSLGTCSGLAEARVLLPRYSSRGCFDFRISSDR